VRLLIEAEGDDNSILAVQVVERTSTVFKPRQGDWFLRGNTRNSKKIHGALDDLRVTSKAWTNTTSSSSCLTLMAPRPLPPTISSGPPRFRCVECSHPVSSLFTIYSKDNVRLTQCVSPPNPCVVPVEIPFACMQCRTSIAADDRINARSSRTSTLNMTLLSYSSISS